MKRSFGTIGLSILSLKTEKKTREIEGPSNSPFGEKRVAFRSTLKKRQFRRLLLLAAGAGRRGGPRCDADGSWRAAKRFAFLLDGMPIQPSNNRIKLNYFRRCWMGDIVYFFLFFKEG